MKLRFGKIIDMIRGRHENQLDQGREMEKVKKGLSEMQRHFFDREASRKTKPDKLSRKIIRNNVRNAFWYKRRTHV